jgi:CHAD domain-containing protein
MYDFVPKIYFEKFSKIIAKSDERLEKYLTDPSEENVHDVRTSIRRLDAAWKVLPKKIRQKKKIAKFVTLRKEFFKINSQIRDFDIIRQKLTVHPSDDTQQIIAKIDQKKQIKLKSAQNKAKEATKTSIKEIDQSIIPSEKLEKRFEKITLTLISEIETCIPIVISNEKKIEQLHELRKHCKKLRYLLELTTHDESSSFITKLKEMQDVLGSIRDCDIAIDFLKKLGKMHNIDHIIKVEAEKRDQLYKKFVQMQKL